MTYGISSAPGRNLRLSPNSIKADTNRLYIIIIAILCFTTAPVVIAGDIIKHYDRQNKTTGYTVIDGDRQTHYDSSWNRTGHTISEETKDTHCDIEQNRIGHTEWDNDDTGPKESLSVYIGHISDILNGTMMIPAAIMTKSIIEPDIPRNIKTKKPHLTILGTARDIKNENKSKKDRCKVLISTLVEVERPFEKE